MVYLIIAILKIRCQGTWVLENYVSDFTVPVLPSKQRQGSVFKFLHSGERFQIYPFSVGENAGYVWTRPMSVEIFLRCKIYPDTCGGGLNIQIQS